LSDAVTSATKTMILSNVRINQSSSKTALGSQPPHWTNLVVCHYEK